MIYLVRHGQTVLNLEGRYQGRIDSPLTPLGIAQAQAVACRLAEIKTKQGGDWRPGGGGRRIPRPGAFRGRLVLRVEK